MSSYHHIFGIRHHGPGSARALKLALEQLKPDYILVEGPPDGNDAIYWLGHTEMEPPVALLIYRPDKPEKAGYYPFALFSPELQAIRYGLKHNLPVRFMDLPQANIMAAGVKITVPDIEAMQRLTQATGYKDYEAWWNVMVEQRQDVHGIFDAVFTLMRVLRETPQSQQVLENRTDDNQIWAERREASMRQAIRTAIKAGYGRIAVVCGAWHAPALINLENETADTTILHNLASVNVEAAWVPWTYGRLANASGYGAGIRSPGWYQHLWQMGQQNATPADISINWLAKVAHLLRAKELDASSAHIIEAVRLAEALAAMRGLPFPGLLELNETTQTVLCFGDAEPMRLIQKELIVSEQMGAVPADTPMIPLQRDLHRQQKRLRLHPNPQASILKLDLRNAMHLDRSHLLHRLQLLKIPWGLPKRVRGNMGTSHEAWQLQWQPDFAIRIIEAGMWGNTVKTATAAFAQDKAQQAANLSELTRLLDTIILADLPEVIADIIGRIKDEAALSSDVVHMMGALPPLARILRYGNVRQTDTAVIRQVVDGLLTRICIGLPSSCLSLDDDAAEEMCTHVTAVHTATTTLRDNQHSQSWHETLATITDETRVHDLLCGRTCRLLLDTAVFTTEDAAIRMERALSLSTLSNRTTEKLGQAAAWLSGFLQGSELLIIHDQRLWQLMDRWLTHLDDDHFQAVLPLLRRTFANFSEASRQQIQARIYHGSLQTKQDIAPAAQFDHETADSVLPLVSQLLGL